MNLQFSYNIHCGAGFVPHAQPPDCIWRNPLLAAANTPLANWLPPIYEDGISQPVGWDPSRLYNGVLLPLVREVSNRILSTADADVQGDSEYTHLVTFFGQWNDHDLSFTPHSSSIRSFSSGINCDESCYTAWRRFCNLSTPQNEAELAVVLNNTDLARRLIALYGNPANIDVWVAGVSEPFVLGGRVGPLFSCLIATQFQKIRQGDRVWWENHGVFTKRQRASLASVSLARIICDNTGIRRVPGDPFRLTNRSDFTDCNEIVELDLTPWIEAGKAKEQMRLFALVHYTDKINAFSLLVM
ncbi:hypothetical protein SRHO_G00218450 [Serrasalmus rhombeus]